MPVTSNQFIINRYDKTLIENNTGQYNFIVHLEMQKWNLDVHLSKCIGSRSHSIEFHYFQFKSRVLLSF